PCPPGGDGGKTEIRSAQWPPCLCGANGSSRELASDGKTAREVFRELHVEVLVGGDPDVVDHLLHAAAAHLLAELVDLLEVRLAERPGIDEQLRVLLQPFEERHPLERERELELVEDVEDD